MWQNLPGQLHVELHENRIHIITTLGGMSVIKSKIAAIAIYYTDFFMHGDPQIL